MCETLTIKENENLKPNIIRRQIMNYRVSAFMFHYLHKLKGYSMDAAKSPMFELWQVEPQWLDILELMQQERMKVPGTRYSPCYQIIDQ